MFVSLKSFNILKWILSRIRNPIIQVKASCIVLGRLKSPNIALVHIKFCWRHHCLVVCTSCTWLHFTVTSKIWFMAIFTMRSLSYTAWRRMIVLLVNDRRAYGTDLDRGCCFGKYKAVRSSDLLSEIKEDINLSPIAVSTRLRHPRFLRKFSHRRSNRGCIVTRPKRSDSQCNGNSLEVHDQKKFDLFLLRESKGSQFSGSDREYF